MIVVTASGSKLKASVAADQLAQGQSKASLPELGFCVVFERTRERLSKARATRGLLQCLKVWGAGL